MALLCIFVYFHTQIMWYQDFTLYTIIINNYTITTAYFYGLFYWVERYSMHRVLSADNTWCAFFSQEPTPTPPIVVSTPPITVVCNCDTTRTHPSIVVSPGCSHQLRFLPTGQLVKPTEDPPARQVSMFRYYYSSTLYNIILVLYRSV